MKINYYLLQDETSPECCYNASDRLLAENWFGWTVEIVNLLRRITTDTDPSYCRHLTSAFFTNTVSGVATLFPGLSGSTRRMKVLKQ